MTAPAELVLDIPKEWWRTSNNERGHWSKNAPAKRWVRSLAMLEARRQRIPHFDRVRIVAYVSYPPRVKVADPANAAPMFKAIVDGCVDAGVLDDDDATRVAGPDPRLGPSTGVTGLHTITLHFHPIEEPTP